MQARVGMLGKTGQNVSKPCLWVDIIKTAGCDECEHGGSAIGPTLGAGEGPVAASQCNAPFILPMSAMKSRYIIAGIRISARGFPFAA